MSWRTSNHNQRQRHAHYRCGQSALLMIEALESRVLLDLKWTGVNNKEWFNKENWIDTKTQEKRIPTDKDRVLFDGTAQRLLCEINHNAFIKDIVIDGFSGTIDIKKGRVLDLLPGGISTQRSGTITGDGDLTIHEDAIYGWSGGSRATSQTGGGTTNVRDSASFQVYGTVTLDRKLEVWKGGQVIWSGGSIITGERTVIQIDGRFSTGPPISGKIEYNPKAVMVINKGGELSIGAAQLTASILIKVNNHGTVDVGAGSSLILGSDGESSGSFDVRPTGSLCFCSPRYYYSLKAGTKFGGEGRIRLAGKLENAVGDEVKVKDFHFVWGDFRHTGTSKTTITRDFHWWSGSLSSPGTSSVFYIDVSGSAYIGLGVNTLAIERVEFRNAGISTLFGSTLEVNNGGAIVNYWDFYVVGGTIKQVKGPNKSRIENQGGGRWIKSLGGSVGGGVDIRLTFVNYGSVLIESGTMSVGEYTQHGGQTIVKAGTSLLGSCFMIHGGTVSGFGTITGKVWMSGGDIAPGNGVTTGILTINGDFTHVGAGRIVTRINGTTPGVTHDQLVITGQARYNSVQVLDPDGLYSGSIGDTFELLRHGSRDSYPLFGVNPGFSDPLIVNAVSGGVPHYEWSTSSFRAVIIPYTAVHPGPDPATVFPSSGGTGGGTVIAVDGVGFTAADVIMFRNQSTGGFFSPQHFQINSDTSISVTTPPHEGGAVQIVVYKFNAIDSGSGLSNSFTYTSSPLPNVSGLAPNYASPLGGSTVVISGSNFGGASAVSFNGVACACFTVDSPTQITAYVPTASASEDYVRVTTYSGQSTGGPQFTYLSGPTLFTLSQSVGSTAGGASVTITGDKFSQATAVLFGDTPSTSYSVNPDGTITALSPPRPAGTVDITVVTYSGTSAIIAADKFTYTLELPPTVSGINQPTGTTVGGTSVVITGNDFNGTTEVMFGTVPATSFTLNSPTQITAVSPPQGIGDVHITVTTYSGTSQPVTADKFTYTVGDLPTVTGLSPPNGSSGGGIAVTVTGTNFSGVTKVFFGTLEAAFIVNSATSITAYAPAQMPPNPGTVRVIVRTYSGDSPSGSDVFTYQPALPPAVTGLSPNTGTQAGGTTVTITGTDLLGTSVVEFDSVPATWFRVDSNTQITAVTPAQSAIVVGVRVTTPTGTYVTTDPNRFTYQAVAAPTVSSLSTTTGSTNGGRPITITGTNFVGVTAVSFGYVQATSFTVDSATQITAVTPPHYAGYAHVTVTTAYGSSATSLSDRFQFVANPAAPTVTGLNPPNGSTAGGTSVIITGTNLTYTTAVMFGTIPAVSFTVNSATQVTAVSPPQAAGNVYITVTTDAGTSANSEQFLYQAAALPTVSGISVASGTTAGGTLVTITGTNFLGAYEVTFGGTLATAFSVDSDTQITVLAPPRVAGPAVHVRVRTYGNQSAENPNDLFTYVPGVVPIVSGVSPATGSTAGNTVVVISGVYFTGVTAVRFGSVDATTFALNSDGQITAVAPAQGIGTVHITVVTTGGTSEILTADSYTYVTAAIPIVTALSVSNGTTDGGTFVQLTGSYFTGATSVRFGATDATWFTVESDTSILALSPAGTAGPGPITVLTPLGTSAPASFTYVAPAVVQELRSSFGPTSNGGSVTIIGTGFVGVTAVYFDGVPVAHTVNTSTQITVTAAPTHAPGVAFVTVETTSGIFSALRGQAEYTYVLAPIRTGFTANVLPANDDSSDVVQLGFTVNFFGLPFSDVYVNNNGNVTFAGPLSYFTPFTMESSTVPIIAPFFADVDTLAGAIVSYGTGTIGTNAAFVVNWVNVGYFDQHVDKTNVFQLALISRPDLGTGAFDIEFNYAWITWETGDSSGGTEGLGGYSARVGYSKGTGSPGTYYELANSGVPSALLDDATTGLVNGPEPPVFGEYGRYVYTIVPSPDPGGGDGGGEGGTSPGAPVIRGMKPRRGPATGGTVVTVLGANFQGVTEILFGTVPVRSFQVFAGRRIVVTAPPRTAELVFLRVRTTSGLSDLTPFAWFRYVGLLGPDGGEGDGGQGMPRYNQPLGELARTAPSEFARDANGLLFGLGQGDWDSPPRLPSQTALDPLSYLEEVEEPLPLPSAGAHAVTMPMLDSYFAELMKDETHRLFQVIGPDLWKRRSVW